jgi:hypothetical protein
MHIDLSWRSRSFCVPTAQSCSIPVKSPCRTHSLKTYPFDFKNALKEHDKDISEISSIQIFNMMKIKLN